MPEPRRGEVWIVDLGYAAKTRPCLAVSDAAEATEMALIAYIPCTTARRDSRFQVPIDRPFLDSSSVFDAQGVGTADRSKFRRRIGRIDADELSKVEGTLKRWLGLQS
jgi:mRNA interferase MazF